MHDHDKEYRIYMNLSWYTDNTFFLEMDHIHHHQSECQPKYQIIRLETKIHLLYEGY